MRALLIGGWVPPFHWSEALLCAAHLHNRSPIIGKNGKIPILYRKDLPTATMNLCHLRTFGCAAYTTLPVSHRDGNLAPTSVTGVMVGYDNDRKAYRIYLPHIGTVITAKYVRFDEYYYPLADTDASHHSYDFATGVLEGVPPYPQSANIPGLTGEHLFSISFMCYVISISILPVLPTASIQSLNDNVPQYFPSRDLYSPLPTATRNGRLFV